MVSKHWAVKGLGTSLVRQEAGARFPTGEEHIKKNCQDNYVRLGYGPIK